MVLSFILPFILKTTMADNEPPPPLNDRQASAFKASLPPALLVAKALQVKASPAKLRSDIRDPIEEAKRKLALSTEPCWASTGRTSVCAYPRISKQRGATWIEYKICFLKYRSHKHKGKKQSKSGYKTQKEAICAMYDIRFNAETPTGKQQVQEHLQEAERRKATCKPKLKAKT